MKNMKKTILGVALIAMLLITMMGSVNAASVSAPAEVKKGETVAVTVSMASPVKAVEFEMKYDASKFEFTGATAGALGKASASATNGVVTVAIAASDGVSTTETVTLTFTALAETEAKGFTISNVVSDTDNTITNATASTAVVEDVVVDPEEPETPGNDNENKEPVKDEKPATDGKVGTDGKVITTIYQAGTPVALGAIALIVVAGVVLVARKTK